MLAQKSQSIVWNAMPVYIALLRGINVGGQKLIKMDALRKHFEAFGGTDVQTYIQSGNVVFKHRSASAATVRKGLEAHLEAKLGYRVPTLVINASELEEIIAGNPYDATETEFGRRMYVCFFEKAPAVKLIEALAGFITEKEQFVLNEVAGYALYAEGLGKAKLSNAVIERKLGMATMRNWNTVNALMEMAKASSTENSPSRGPNDP